MNSQNLIGKTIQIGIGDVYNSSVTTYQFDRKINATIIAVKQEAASMAVKLNTVINTNGILFSHAIIESRLVNISIESLLMNKIVSCNVILIPQDRFSAENPFDYTWWRGGPATVADISIMNIS